MCGDKQHFIINGQNIQFCDKGQLSECLPSWRMYDLLMLEMFKYFEKSEIATSSDEKQNFNRLSRQFHMKARDILKELHKSM